MRILLIESDESISALAIQILDLTYLSHKNTDSNLLVVATDDLSEAMGLMVIENLKFELIICAETVFSSFGDNDSGNGLRYMTETGDFSKKVILADSNTKRIYGIQSLARDTESIKTHLPNFFQKFLMDNIITIN